MSASGAQEPIEGSRWVRVIAALRHPLRVLVLAVGAICLAFSVAPAGAWWAAGLGAVLGWGLGERLAGSSYRLAAVLAGAVGLAVAASMVAGFVVGTQWVAALLGPGTALGFASFLKYIGWSMGLVAGLRAFSKRVPAAAALEVAFVVIAVAAVFAAHRDGIIARPLWLSDWAWRAGHDPANILLGVGGTAAGLMALLMVFEQRGKVSVATLLMLPLLALGIVSCLEVTDLPTPQPDDGIGLTDEQVGEPSLPTDAGGSNGENGRDGGGEQGGADSGADGGAGGGGDSGFDGSSGSVEERGDGGGSSGADSGADGGGSSGADAGADGGGSGGADSGADGGGSSGADSGADGGGSSSADSGADGGGADDGGDAALPTPSESRPEGGAGESSDEARQSDEPPETDDPRPSPPVAIVIFRDDYEPPSGTFYFRQNALSEWNGSRLVPTEIEGADLDYLRTFPTQEVELDGPPPEHRARVRAKVALIIGHDEPFALESPVSFAPVQNPNPQRFHSAYNFESLAQEVQFDALMGLQAGNPLWTDEQRELYLRPHPDERFGEWAREAVAEVPPHLAEDPFARAVAIKLRMDRELTYSTRERHADVEDPTVDFFFGNKIGYCVHFAHAAVFLWRSLGIPARAATGYAVDASARGTGSSLMITGDTSHMWPELYLEGVGWVVLDIAAQENLDPPGTPPDEELQRLLGEMAREEPPDEGEGSSPAEERPPSKDFSEWFWPLALFFVCAGILLLYLIKLIRRLAPAFATDAKYPRAAFRACLDRLVDAGLERKFGESREEFAERVHESIPSFTSLTELHVAIKLGDPGAPIRAEMTRDRWDPALRTFKSELRAGTKWWRRLLGFFHPASFIDSR